MFLGQAPSDPAARHGWRVRIDEAIREVRKAGASASHRERAEMERAINRFESTLAEAGGVIREPGWVGYVGADRVHLAQVAPVAMTTSALAGQRHPDCAAPASHPGGAAGDHCDGGQSAGRALPILRWTSAARRHIARACPHRAWHPYGQRAATALSRGHPRTHRDGPSAARTSCGTPAFMTVLAERMLDLARPDAWMLLGGAPVAVHEALATVLAATLGRVHALPELHLHATPAEITAAAAGGTLALEHAHDLELVQRTLEAAGAGGRGTEGLPATSAAVGEGRASQLLVTPRFLQQFPAEAERVIRGALDEDADIDVIAGRGAELLDAHAGGIGSTLRYPANRAAPASTASASA